MDCLDERSADDAQAGQRGDRLERAQDAQRAQARHVAQRRHHHHHVPARTPGGQQKSVEKGVAWHGRRAGQDKTGGVEAGDARGGEDDHVEPVPGVAQQRVVREDHAARERLHDRLHRVDRRERVLGGLVLLQVVRRPRHVHAVRHDRQQHRRAEQRLRLTAECLYSIILVRKERESRIAASLFIDYLYYEHNTGYRK